MREPQRQNHVTLKSRSHVTNKKCCISIFTRPMVPKLVIQDEGIAPTKWHNTSIEWSSDRPKVFYLNFERHKAHTLSRLETNMVRPHPKCHVIP